MKLNINMVKFFKNIVRKIAIYLAFGLKNAEVDILKTNTSKTQDSSLEQNKVTNELADALLKGEITEEVELLRDRTYFVLEESKKYKVSYVNEESGEISSSKKLLNINKPKVFNEDGYEVKIIQENNLISDGVLDRLNSIETDLTNEKYPLKFTYELNPPKYKLEKYFRKVVVRVDKNGGYRVDLYSPKFTDSIRRMERIFDNELKNIFTKKTKFTNVLFQTIGFLTENAYGAEDLKEYKFELKDFVSITDIKSDFILTYNVEPITLGDKITDKYIKKDLREKYKNKERRGQKATAVFENLEKK